MDPVIHFEMPYEDAKRVARFYAQAFGWQTQALGEDMGHYVLATTIESAKRTASTEAINGGFFPKKPDWPVQHPSVVIAVQDVAVAIERVQQAGGVVLGEPMQIPGIGKYVSITDTEGNRVGMLEALMSECPAS
jgi:predicted enzyme related to lactoylglutathione lyase